MASELFQSLAAHTPAAWGQAFFGGILCSVLPCTLSMLPMIIGYMGGWGSNRILKIAGQALLLTLGLSLTVAWVGSDAAGHGLPYGATMSKTLLSLVGFFSMLLAGILLAHQRFSRLTTQYGLSQAGWRWITPISVGLIFGLAASPCGTVYMADLMGFMTRHPRTLYGVGALFAYAMGQGILYIVIGTFVGLLRLLALRYRVGSVIRVMSAVILIIFGVFQISVGCGLLPALLGTAH